MRITSRWSIVQLGEVVEHSQYGTSVKANDNGTGVPVLRMSNITYTGSIDLREIKHVELPGQDLEKYSVRRGDLLFNRTNSQDLVGKMAVWNRDERFAFAGYLVRMRLRSQAAYPAFVAAWFNTPAMKSLLRSRAKPSINMSNINAREILKFPLVLPPVSEQRRIAEVLDRAEALRAKRRAALVLLDTLTRSIFLDMFGDPGSNPMGWPTDRLSNLSDQVTDGEHLTPKRAAQGIKLLSARNVRDGWIDFENVDYVGQEEFDRIRRRCNPTLGDILISCSGTIGRVARVESNEPFALVRSAALVRSKPGALHSKFLESYLRTPTLHARMVRRANASSQANLFQNQIRALEIFCPPLIAQESFAQKAAGVAKLKVAQKTSLTKVDELFASLQHRAFRGEL